MKISNKHNLPMPLINALKKQERKPIKNFISCTELMDSPQIRRLKIAHWDEIEIDAMQLIRSLRGTMIHKILEEGAPDDYITENETLHVFVGNWCVTGKPDLFEPETGTLTDYKTTSVWALNKNIGDAKEKAEIQLNIYSWLMAKCGVEVTKLRVEFFCNDWRSSEYDKYDVYPLEWQGYDLNLWPLIDTETYIMAKLALHSMPNSICSDKERWIQKSVWKVHKEGRKTSLRNFDTGEEGEEFLRQSKESGLTLKEYPGNFKRCYPDRHGITVCPVAKFCTQKDEVK
jgi:hypothetical protein